MQGGIDAAAVSTPEAAAASGRLDEEKENPMTEEILPASNVRLAARAASRDDAIREAGAILVEAGAVEPAYVDSMLERENSVSTYMGNFLAIPHGTN